MSKYLGDRVRAKRLELGWTQDQLGQRIGYKSRTSINKIELGIYDLPLNKIKQLADVLGVTPDYLMGWDLETMEPAEETPTDKLLTLISALNHEEIEQVNKFVSYLIATR